MNKLFNILSMGAGSTIGVSAVAIILQIFVVSYLSRVDSEYVAFIAIFEIFTAWIIALCFFGGEQHFVNVYNRSDNKKHVLTTYLFSYFTLLFPFSLVFYVLLSLDYINTGGFDILGLYLTCISIGFSSVTAAYYRSRLKILLASLLEKFTVCSFYLFLLVFFLYGDEKVNSYLIIYSIFTQCGLLYFVRGELSISKNILSLSKEIFSKGGFFFFLTLLIILIYERIDQMVLLSKFNLTDLAGYFACFKLAFLIRFISKSVNSSMYPYLSKLS
ncbi:hypothetical protein, partial [Vibrio navarrensis]|uniref:hypothetical protein n=1 Tax=Vibrio navarrensis TaxID=29495 RepID=UPI00186999BF